MFPKIGVPQNGLFIMENLIKMDDLGVPLFLETPICFCGIMRTAVLFFFGRDITSKFELKMLKTPMCCRLGATARSFGVQSGQPTNLNMTRFEVLELRFDCVHL